jgi:hypothetical protein
VYLHIKTLDIAPLVRRIFTWRQIVILRGEVAVEVPAPEAMPRR